MFGEDTDYVLAHNTEAVTGTKGTNYSAPCQSHGNVFDSHCFSGVQKPLPLIDGLLWE